MKDDDLMAAVRQPFAGITMTMPLDAVIARGRSRRRRRRLPGLTAATVSAVAGVALVVSALGGGTGRSAPAPADLAAWTVVRQPSGIIAVTVRELSDPAGLQRTLNADKVPAVVVFDEPAHAGCDYSGHTLAILRKVLQRRPSATGAVFLIDPAAIPSGARLWLDVGSATARPSSPSPQPSAGKPSGIVRPGLPVWAVAITLLAPGRDCPSG